MSKFIKFSLTLHVGMQGFVECYLSKLWYYAKYLSNEFE